MKNSLFLDYYQHLQYQIMYQKLIDLGFASVVWCSKYESSFFNYAGVNRQIDNHELKKIEKTMINLARKPAVYFENRGSLSKLVKFLVGKDYTKNWEDSWMFHDGNDIDTSKFFEVKIVNDRKSLEKFLETFDRCYQEDDPQNPYGVLGDYLNVAKDAWYQHKGTGKIEYYTVFDNKKPVAVSTLTNFAQIGYISNVGSLKEVRGKGFGKTASLYCVVRSRENGNTEHVLATEEGQYPNEFYNRIGFKTRFTAVGYVKK